MYKHYLCLVLCFTLLSLINVKSALGCMYHTLVAHAACLQSNEGKPTIITSQGNFYSLPNSYVPSKNPRHGIGQQPTIFLMHDTEEAACQYLLDEHNIKAENIYSHLHSWPLQGGMCKTAVKKISNIPDFYSNVVKIVLNQQRSYNYFLDTYNNYSPKFSLKSFFEKRLSFVEPLKEPQAYYMKYISTPKSRRAQKLITFISQPDHYLKPVRVVCEQSKASKTQDPMANWITDGNLRHWEICEVKFIHKGMRNIGFTRTHIHNDLLVSVIVHGKHLAVSENGLYIEPFIEKISRFLSQHQKGFLDQELLDTLEAQIKTEKDLIAIPPENSERDWRYTIETRITRAVSLGDIELATKLTRSVEKKKAVRAIYEVMAQLDSHIRADYALAFLQTIIPDTQLNNQKILCMATSKGNKAILSFLLDHAPEYNHQSQSLFACSIWNGVPNYETLNVLLEKGIDPYHKEKHGRSGRSFIDKANAYNKIHLIKWSKEKGLDVSKLVKQGNIHNK